MEIKLYVMTHKDKTGSTIYATQNMSEHEIEIIEASTSRRNKSSEYELKEKSHGGYWVYFFSYKGGKDEFGRDYQEIIASAFTYRLTITEGEKLRKIFYRIKNEIKLGNFSIEKTKFVGIKRRNDLDRFKKNRINLWKKHLKFILFLILMISVATFVYDYAKKNPGKLKIITELRDYAVKKSIVEVQMNNIKKYEKNIDVVESEIVCSEDYFNRGKKEINSEFYEIINDKNIALKEIIKQIKEEVGKAENIKELTSDESNENRMYILIEKSVSDYNNSLSSEKLLKIKELCKVYLEKYSSLKSIKIKYYFDKADKISSGEKNINLNVDLFVKKNSPMVWKRVEIEFSGQDKLLKKEIESEERKKLSKMRLKMKYEDSAYIKVYIAEDDERKLVASFGLKVDEMNKEEKITVGEDEFYLKFNPDYSEFIL